MNEKSHEEYSRKQLAYLKVGMVECFDSSELESVCFDLGEDHEKIKGSGLEEKAQEMVAYFRRRGRLAELEEYCRQIRPNYNWDQNVKSRISTTELAEWQRRKQREAELVSSLRNERLPAYKALWASLEPLALYARPKPFTLEEANKLSDALRNWYFQVGGIYLSERCRKTYIALAETLDLIIENLAENKNWNETLSEEIFETLRKKGSDLRTTMAEDLGTRR
jgi:hypothetical protein